MINPLKALSLAAVATVAAVSAGHAATTNFLQSIDFKLTVYSQGAIKPNKHTGLGVSSIVTNSMNTKGLLAVLGTNLTGTALPPAATLALATPPGGSPSIVVVDGTSIYPVSTNIIPYFGYTGSPVGDIIYSTNGTPISETPEILAATQNINLPGTLDVTLSGVATIKTTGKVTGKGANAIVTGIYDSDLTVSGTGTLGTTPVIVIGTITESYWKTLIVP
ncbi:MAG: hypothetical protein ACLQVY_14710 [Limisphaerales bacterium]